MEVLQLRPDPEFDFSGFLAHYPQYLFCPFSLILIQMGRSGWKFEWKLLSGQQLPFLPSPDALCSAESFTVVPQSMQLREPPTMNGRAEFLPGEHRAPTDFPFL